nr:MAG TPA: tail assembly chaperone protein [Bacteriophage sp.]
MKATLGGKEYTIQFATRPSLKAHILQDIMKSQEMEDISSMEDVLLETLPKVLLVGLQMHHNDEFGYDYKTNDGYDEKLEKVSGILYDAIDTNEINCMDLFADMQEEMMTNGFLAQMMESMQRAEAEAQEKKKTPSKAKAKN